MAAPAKIIFSAISAIGSTISALSQLQQARYQSNMADYNAQVAAQDARYKKDLSVIELSQHSDRVKRLKSKQQVGLLASGVTLEGSALDLLADTAAAGEFDAQLIEFEGETGVEQSLAESRIAQREAKFLRRSGPVRAAGSLLSSASRFASR